MLLSALALTGAVLMALVALYMTALASGVDGPGDPDVARHLAATSAAVLAVCCSVMAVAGWYVIRRRRFGVLLIAAAALLVVGTTWFGTLGCVLDAEATSEISRCYPP